MMRLIPSALNQSKNLYAYLPLDSMTAALVRAIHTWLSETESQITKVTFFFLLVDMSKVFDWVDHAKLMQHILDSELCPDWPQS